MIAVDVKGAGEVRLSDEKVPRYALTSRRPSAAQRVSRDLFTAPMKVTRSLYRSTTPNMAGPKSPPLKNIFADALPKDVPFTFYHYSTPPVKSPALYNAPPHSRPERTYCESHTLAVSITPKDGSGSQLPDELLILAIEVLIYTTKQLTTIFVSKADSTGYLSVLDLARSQAASPLKAICGNFVSWLARERHRDGQKLVVSLFARAQDQYLFPGSIENKDKHVLDDRGLVKWWCRVLDPLMREYAPEKDEKPLTERLANGNDEEGRTEAHVEDKKTAKGYLVIPGFDPYDILRYVPAPRPNEPRRWAASHPLLRIAPHAGAPPRCLVPHFPDDPKSRFLDELDEELPDSRSEETSQVGGTPSRSNGLWRSVRTLEQFWEMMAFRQECSSGRIVGFVWVVITPPKSSIPEEDEQSEPSQSQSQYGSQESIASLLSPPKKPLSKKALPGKSRRKRVNTSYGPIPLLLPRIKSSSSNLSVTSTGSNGTGPKLPPESTPYYTWPTTSRGTILLSSTAYNRAHEILVHQNFATRSAAAKSTKKWRDEVAVLGGVENWSWTITGKKENSSAIGVAEKAVAPVTLMGVRKKRKSEAPVEAEVSVSASAVSVLVAGSVRKKVKMDKSLATTNADTSPATNGINTLGATLVRKKPKK
jgi:regulator of Ty1 transposition protein 109